ncbi:excinuclease ABC subunit UvrA [Candidatus Cardinium sp. TP]|uniref:excinuclease ABC subunit UvrA n=1 Tax=Candidatus Cardinium sp. TP TaxID=2961955 RepID=UPI0021AF2576|nr:excinuclease ABC subunit UvrA [Candidatus Cardinium sp. TP]MCT4696863.1 excinuclease ABC subunit UvrA [Candidatus Cardinium sp. TP]MDN5246688.1 excinuclease ABC subunit UvrA [Candidatus Cardinium sp.]
MIDKMDREQANHSLQDRYGFDYVEVLGARTHNLKNIDVVFPRNQLVIITGVSGSGKSSLAFDTINAEGQRRYRESFSAYARGFLGSLTRPEVDKINGLSPVIAIEQKTTNRNVRSTVGTTTEIYDFMRLLFARVADAYAYTTGNRMVTQDEEQILSHLLRAFSKQRVTLMAPVIRGRKGHHEALLKRIMKLGFNKVRVNGTLIELTDSLKLARHKKHDVALIIDHVLIDLKALDRIKNALQLALKYGKGTLLVVDPAQKEHYFSTHLMDEETGLAYDAPEPSLFSFNTPYGACPICDGLGEITHVDIDTIIPDKSISIKNGAILPLGSYKTSLLFKKIEALLRFFQCKLTDPVEILPPAVLNLLLFGNVIPYRSTLIADCAEPFEGIIAVLIKQQEREMAARNGSLEEGFVYTTICPDCQGTRLNPIARSFKIQDKSITDLVEMDLDALKQWFATLSTLLTEKQQIIAHEIIQEITKRLQFLIDVGLHYLHLNRSISTLSGGEAQRIRLATQIGTQLLGVLYILDEPSIGLHQRDNSRLIGALKALRDIGNTVLVVEHDKEIMLAADYLIEIGPQAGLYGGEVVAAGPLNAFLAQPSATAVFLTDKTHERFNRKPGNGKTLTISGCRGNNLKNVTLTLPLGLMICVTGVSGSGKSSLIRKTLLPILKKHLYNSRVISLPYTEALGLAHINKVIEVSQSPIGRTPRSNPSTYTGMFTDIRSFFAILPEAKIRGYKPGRFSFNLKEGRCNTCEGAGIQRIEMGFLPEVYVTCDSCKGKRYSRETLEIQYKGKSIADILDMTVSNAIPFFESHPSILVKLRTLEQVGLGYITLGQHATTLSGGEAQRVKLATELAKKSTGDTLYILDEPSTGLHFQDILALLSVLKKLVDQGNTVLIIEHNMDMIKVADYLIDIGPDGGREGGYLIAQGTPEAVAKVPESYTGHCLQKELYL